MESWKTIQDFPTYSVSDGGRVRNDETGRILSQSENQFDLMCVGLMRDGKQHHRSVPKLVATAFIPRPRGPFDTAINLDGNRRNNRADNLVWRPRWFAVLYNRQFRHPYKHSIEYPVYDIRTGESWPNSFECAVAHGVLEEDLVLSILNRTYVWPTHQIFAVAEH